MLCISLVQWLHTLGSWAWASKVVVNNKPTVGTTSQQSHVTTSPTVYAQASQGFVSQYPVRPYPNPIVTTGYQVNQYASGSYGANPHLSYSNTIAPQPAATMPYGGVQKFQNPEQATDAELLVKGIKSYRKFGGIVPSNYQLDTSIALSIWRSTERSMLIVLISVSSSQERKSILCFWKGKLAETCVNIFLTYFFP